jgi:hypothetical protein
MIRYRILVFLLVLVAIATGYSLSQPDSPIANAAFLTAIATAVLGIFVAKPELYNPGAPFFRPGGVARARKRAVRILWLGLGLMVLGMAFGGIFYATANNPGLADGFNLSVGYLIVVGMAFFCGGLFAWCVAWFLKDEPVA